MGEQVLVFMGENSRYRDFLWHGERSYYRPEAPRALMGSQSAANGMMGAIRGAGYGALVVAVEGAGGLFALNNRPPCPVWSPARTMQL